MHTHSSGFTIAELLIAVLIIAILAGITIPQFSTMVEDAQETTTAQELQRIRTGIEYYAFQHEEAWPGLDPNTTSWSATALLAQLTQATDENGYWAAPGTPGFEYGPYLLEGIPVNLYNNLADVVIVPPGGPASGYPNDASGWVYFAIDGTFRANTTALNREGEPIWDL